MRRTLGILFLVAAVSGPVGAVAAGRPADRHPDLQAAWMAAFDSPVRWHRVTHFGHLVVATDTGLHGVDPATGRVVWAHAALSGLSEREWQEIPHTPLVAVGEGYKKNWIVVLDAGDGRIAFDSRAAGFSTIHGYAALPRSGSLLVAGFKANSPAVQVARVDLATGREQWANAGIVGGGKSLAAGIGRVNHALTGRAEFTLNPLEVDDATIALSTSPGLHRVDLRTGQAAWSEFRLEGDRNVRLFLDPKRPDRVYVGSEMALRGAVLTSGSSAYLNAYRLADGGRLWRQPVLAGGSLRRPIFLGGGIIVAPEAQAGGGTVKLIDAASGASLWGKKGYGVNLPGGLTGHAVLDAGLVVTTGNDAGQGRTDTDQFLSLLDPATGAPRLARPLRVKGPLLAAEAVPTGILYVTAGEVGILDPGTGAVAGGARVVSPGTLVTARHGERLYAFSSGTGTLHAVDLRRGTVGALNPRPVRLEDGDAPVALEARPDGLVLLGRWSVAAFGFDGTLRHQSHHPAPRRPLAQAVLERGRAIRAAMRAVSAGTCDGAFALAAVKEPGSLGRSLVATLPGGLGGPPLAYGGAARPYGEAARSRFAAAARPLEYAVMLVERPDGAYGLAKVSVATGAVAGVVSFGRDRDPAFDTDPIAGRVFLRRAPSEIAAYAF